MTTKMLEMINNKKIKFEKILKDKELKGFEVFTDLFYKDNNDVRIEVEIGTVTNNYKEYSDFSYFAVMNFDSPVLLLDEIEDCLRLIIKDKQDRQKFLINLNDIIIYDTEYETLYNNKKKTTIVYKSNNIEYRIIITAII